MTFELQKREECSVTTVSPPSHYYKPKTNHSDRVRVNCWAKRLPEGLKERQKHNCRVLWSDGYMLREGKGDKLFLVI